MRIFLRATAGITGDGVAVDVDDGAGMYVFAYTGVVFDLTVLRDGGRAVDEEVEIFVGGDTDGQGVGAEHAFNTEGGSDGRTGVCTGDTDAAFLAGHPGIVAGDAVVAGVAHNDHAHAVLLCLVDSHSHGLVADDLAHTVVTVNDSGGLGLLNDLKVGHGVLDTRLDAVKVDGLEAVDTVGLDAALVALQQNVGADLGVRIGECRILQSCQRRNL